MQKSIILAGEAWVKGVKAAKESGDDMARDVERGTKEIKKSQNELRDQLVEIMKN